jgi:Bacterial toxin 44
LTPKGAGSDSSGCASYPQPTIDFGVLNMESPSLFSPIDGSTPHDRALAWENRRSRLASQLNGSEGNTVDIECMLPREIPAGYDLKSVIDAASKMNIVDFYRAVRSGGVFDFKHGKGNSVYENFGNFNAGIAAKVNSWIPTVEVLQAGAGVYQVKSGTHEFGWWRTFFDDPRDSAWIDRGWHATEVGTLGATPSVPRAESARDLESPKQQREPGRSHDQERMHKGGLRGTFFWSSDATRMTSHRPEAFRRWSSVV